MHTSFPIDVGMLFGAALVRPVQVGVVVALVLMLVARPVAVAVCLPWFRFDRRELAVVSWAGLRGAVPIVLATIPLTAGHPDGELVFDVGTLVRRLGFDDDVSGARADVAVLDSLVADLIELRLTSKAPMIGRRLRDRAMPNGARVALVVRSDQTFVPDGDMVLTAQDVLLVAVAADTVPATLVRWATDPSAD